MAVIPPHERKHLWERHAEESPAPPTIAQAGDYHEFPRTLHHAGGHTRTVQNEEEKASALKHGWHLSPDDAVPALPQDDTHKKKDRK